MKNKDFCVRKSLATACVRSARASPAQETRNEEFIPEFRRGVGQSPIGVAGDSPR